MKPGYKFIPANKKKRILLGTLEEYDMDQVEPVRAALLAWKPGEGCRLHALPQMPPPTRVFRIYADTTPDLVKSMAISAVEHSPGVLGLFVTAEEASPPLHPETLKPLNP